ncbi:hypothetical protein CEXT_181851 [Caerostris extrusa]|uniref:Uncharacterized protein n=1 Tax=Caerostris extrusa TaxID=172846 RepID=A0AAV4QQT1_CAEEX|nr:hypothetical protein CEXT_181851 [Caerostris extrusa]
MPQFASLNRTCIISGCTLLTPKIKEKKERSPWLWGQPINGPIDRPGGQRPILNLGFRKNSDMGSSDDLFSDAADARAFFYAWALEKFFWWIKDEDIVSSLRGS